MQPQPIFLWDREGYLLSLSLSDLIIRTLLRPTLMDCCRDRACAESPIQGAVPCLSFSPGFISFKQRPALQAPDIFHRFSPPFLCLSSPSMSQKSSCLKVRERVTKGLKLKGPALSVEFLFLEEAKLLSNTAAGIREALGSAALFCSAAWRYGATLHRR